MKKNLSILFTIIIIVGACSAPSPDMDNTLPVMKTEEAPVAVESKDSLFQTPSSNTVALNPPHGEPGHDCNIAVGSPLNGANNLMSAPLPVMPGALNPVNNPTSNKVRLNPPHGEAGHDCNIQVGQPLS
ncbi:MAG: hypothetical protein ABI123_00480 [Ginsengibacter sp.]|jgi:hypothetical protein